jgi:hypothetical protein
MSTLIEFPQVAFVSGSSLPASSPFSLSRLILPILCVSLGVSVGTATGLTLALVNASNHSVAASSGSVESSAAPSANLAANSSPAQATQPTIAASPIASPTTLAGNPAANPTAELRTAKLSPATASVSRSATTPSKVEMAFNKTPDALKPATFKLDGKTYHVARMMSLPAAKPEQHEPIAAQPALPTALNTAQWSLDSPAPASLYTEGVLTVSDYSGSTGTIQTSDGRTFALGTTVAAGNATSWESYRSDVHYRCDQNGSCVLMRAGVVAPDAKLI